MRTKPIRRERHGDAYEILRLMGGEFRLRVMAGAWRLRPIEGGLLFNLPHDEWCSITLTAPDRYRIEIGHRTDARCDGTQDDVPGDKLARTFTALTAISLELPS